MKLIVCGGTNYEDRVALKRAILKIAPTQIAVRGTDFSNDWGTDALTSNIARDLGIPLTSYPVTKDEWTQHGRAAGYHSNSRWLEDFQPDCVLKTTDTHFSNDLVAKSLRAGVRAYEISPNRALQVLGQAILREDPISAADALDRIEKLAHANGRGLPPPQRLFDTIRRDLDQLQRQTKTTTATPQQEQDRD